MARQFWYSIIEYADNGGGGFGIMCIHYTEKGERECSPLSPSQKCKTMTVRSESEKISLSTPKLQTDHTCTCTFMCIVCIHVVYRRDAKFAYRVTCRF